MKRPVLLAFGLTALVVLLLWAAQSGRRAREFDPSPSPENGDPAGIMAYAILLGHRGIPTNFREGLPSGSESLLWFAASGRGVDEEGQADALRWVRRGGRLILVYSSASSAGFQEIERELGYSHRTVPWGEPASAELVGHPGVRLRPAWFELTGAGIRTRGSSPGGRACWIGGSLGDGTWAALSDSFPLENEGLAEGGNAAFALALAGDGLWVDRRPFARDGGRTLAGEPLFWGILIQCLLYGGLLLLQLRRLGPCLQPREVAGSRRLRACLGETLAWRGDLGGVLALDPAFVAAPARERAHLEGLATRGEWKECYRILRQLEPRAGRRRPQAPAPEGKPS